MLNQSIETLLVGRMTSIGTTFIPVIFTDAQTGEHFRIVLYAIVVPKLFMGMFIGRSARFLGSEAWGPEGVMFTFDFGQGGVKKVRGIGL
jgi:prolipoprotein diacylglyceryltransferase